MLLSGMLRHLRLRRGVVGHHHVRLRGHGLLRVVCMVGIRRVSSRGHALILRLGLIVHGLRHMLRLRLAI